MDLNFTFEKDLKNSEGGEYEFVPLGNYEIKDTSNYVDYQGNKLFSKGIGGLTNGDGFYLNKPLQLFSKSFTLEYYWISKDKHTGHTQTSFAIFKENKIDRIFYLYSSGSSNDSYNWNDISNSIIKKIFIDKNQAGQCLIEKWNYIKIIYDNFTISVFSNNYNIFSYNVDKTYSNDLYYIGVGLSSIIGNENKYSHLGIWRNFKLNIKNDLIESNSINNTRRIIKYSNKCLAYVLGPYLSKN